MWYIINTPLELENVVRKKLDVNTTTKWLIAVWLLEMIVGGELHSYCTC